MKQYTHIYHTDKSIEADYSMDELVNKFIVYNGTYLVFNNYKEYFRYFDLPTTPHDYHEVILNKPQKIKFDIDAKVSELNIDYKKLYDHILENIMNVFICTYDELLLDKDIIVCDSTDPKVKYSCHIIIDGFYVTSAEEAREFAKRVYENIDVNYQKFIDMNVYKPVQNFRLIDCYKSTDKHRIKKLTSNHRRENTLITNVDKCKQLPQIVTDVPKYKLQTILSEEDISAIINICNKHTGNHHEFRSILNNRFIYRRTSPSFCDICHVEHQKDNTLMFIVSMADDKLVIHKKCRRQPTKIEIGTIESKTSKIILSGGGVNKLENYIESILKYPVQNKTNIFSSLKNKVEYCKSSMLPYELCKTLVVHAPMKIGKTKQLVQFVNDYFNSSILNQTIRFISFRQTFTNTIKNKFPNFDVYSEHKGNLLANKLIIQVESLYRLEISPGTQPADLLILDECESIFEQFSSGLLKTNIYECFEKFKYLLRFSKHVVCMDAEVGERTFNILKQFRPNFEETVYHHNTFKNATEDINYITSDKKKWVSLIHDSIDNKMKIAILSSSLNEAKILYENIKSNFNIPIKIYSSETSITEKKLHFADVNEYWKKYDVIIYTPTVSAGISFELSHFDRIFCYFTDASCSVETCMQMMGRIREVTKKEYFILISASGNTLPTTNDGILQLLKESRESLGVGFDETGVSMEYNIDGVCNYRLSDFYYIWVENMKLRNKSKNDFVKLLINMLYSKGSKCLLLSCENYAKLANYNFIENGKINAKIENILNDYKSAKNTVKEKDISQIVCAQDIDDDTYTNICQTINKQEEVANDAMYAFKRYNLRSHYKYFMNPITNEFVSKYSNKSTMYIYKNISLIYHYNSTEEALKSIYSKDKEMLEYFINMGESGLCKDLVKNYSYNIHKCLLDLLLLCGWNHIKDEKIISYKELALNLDSPQLNELITKANKLLELKQPKQMNTPEIKLKSINKIFNKFYGLSIAKKGFLCSLKQSSLFNYDTNLSNLEMPTIY